MKYETLRRALEARDADAAVSEDCPEAGVLWDLATGRLDAATARATGAHAVSCGACREALRIARETGASATPASRPAWTRWAAVAAAVVIVGLVAVVLRDPPGRPPVPAEYREGAARILEAESPTTVAVRGEPVVLRWTAVPGARYDVTLSRDDLEVLAVVRGLEEPSYAVPPAVLTDVPPRGTLLWQVEAVWADGRKLRSATFSVRMP